MGNFKSSASQSSQQGIGRLPSVRTCVLSLTKSISVFPRQRGNFWPCKHTCSWAIENVRSPQETPALCCVQPMLQEVDVHANPGLSRGPSPGGILVTPRDTRHCVFRFLSLLSL